MANEALSSVCIDPVSIKALQIGDNDCFSGAMIAPFLNRKKHFSSTYDTIFAHISSISPVILDFAEKRKHFAALQGAFSSYYY